MDRTYDTSGPPRCRRPVCPSCGRAGCRAARGRPRRRRDLRRPAALVAALVLVSYGGLVRPSQAAPGSAACGALATQMRALAWDRIDETLAWYDDGGEEQFAEGNEEFSGLELGNDIGEPPPEPPPPVEVTEPVGNGPTGTNVAERDVDEPDLAKVDGTRVLRLWGQSRDGYAERLAALDDWELAVVDTAADRPRLAGWVKPVVPHRAHEMFVLDGHRVLVVGSVGRSVTVLTLVDVSDAAKPAVLRTTKLAGDYISSRLADGVVRIVLSTAMPVEITPPKRLEPVAIAAVRNRVAVLRKDARDWLPQREILDARGQVVTSGPALDCADVHRPADPRGLGILSVLAVDSRDGADALDRAGGSGLVGGGDVVYAATDRLYVASARGEGAATTVHAFDTTGRRTSPHVGTGSVPGVLVGSSALSRYDGHLRVAVTADDVSSVHVLAEEGAGRLRDVGRVTDLGPGEEIRSVRWFGPLATVVTFRQTDPFYVVDLSRPTAPRLRGALKIPGYSGYLHPAGGGRVLGVGQDADRAGTSRGLQVSAFDITDPAAPRRTDNLVFPGGWGLVENDSRAFTYLPGAGVAVVAALLAADGACPAARGRCWSLGGEVPPQIGLQGWAHSGVPAAVGIRLDGSGRLREVGRFLSADPVLRVLPLGPGRLAAVTASSVVILDAADLRPLGSLVLDPRV